MKTNTTTAPTNSGPKSETTTQTPRNKIENYKISIILCTIPWFGFGFGPAPASLAFIQDIGFCVFHLMLMSQCYKLAKMLQKNAILFTVLAAIPLINIMAIARLVMSANQVLKANKASANRPGSTV